MERFSVVRRKDVVAWNGAVWPTCRVKWFATEHEARTYFNQNANGRDVFELWETDGPIDTMIVASRFPILLVGGSPAVMESYAN